MAKKFEIKLYGGLSLACALVVLMLAGAFFSLRVLMEEQRDLIDFHVQERVYAGQLGFELENQLSLMPVYVLSGNQTLLKAMTDTRRRFSTALQKLRALAQDEKTLALLREAEEMEAQQFSHAQPSIRMRQSGVPIAQVDDYFRTHSVPMMDRLKSTMNQIVEIKVNELADAKRDNERIGRRLVTGLVVASGVTILLAILAASLFARFVRTRQERDRQSRLVLEHERQLSLARKHTVEVVAHDLRGPLAAIRMNLDLIALQGSVSPEIEDTLNVVKRSTDSMRRLIDDLLDHAKIESGHLQLSLGDCNVEALVSEIVERLNPLALKKGIRLEKRVTPETRIVRCDHDRLDQAIANLVGNAIKFTPAGGTVSIEVGSRAGTLTIRVRDTGPGIASDQLEHIFDRYWQARATASQGTGLGLAIVRGIVEAHGGHAEVESELGRGSCFVIHLPEGATRETTSPTFRTALQPT